MSGLRLRMRGEELPVRIRGIGAARALPVTILAELHDSCLRFVRARALRMLFDELLVRLDRVGRLSGMPIALLVTAAARGREHRDAQ